MRDTAWASIKDLPIGIEDLAAPWLGKLIGKALGLMGLGFYLPFASKIGDVVPHLPFGLADWGIVIFPVIAAMIFVARNVTALNADRSTVILFAAVWMISSLAVHLFLDEVGAAPQVHAGICVVFGSMCVAAGTMAAAACGIGLWRIEVFLRNVGLPS